jgi:hypothetical protein
VHIDPEPSKEQYRIRQVQTFSPGPGMRHRTPAVCNRELAASFQELFLVAPSDRFKSFPAHSRLVGYCVVLVAGSSVRTLKTPFAALF